MSGVFGGLPDAVIQFKTTVGTTAAACVSSAPADSLTFLADATNSATLYLGNSDSVERKFSQGEMINRENLSKSFAQAT